MTDDPNAFDDADARRDAERAELQARLEAAQNQLRTGPGLEQSGNFLDAVPDGNGAAFELLRSITVVINGQSQSYDFYVRSSS